MERQPGLPMQRKAFDLSEVDFGEVASVSLCLG
jgi:hypothetical protein